MWLFSNRYAQHETDKSVPSHLERFDAANICVKVGNLVFFASLYV